MAKCAEAFDPMVFAHTACTDPAERQIVLRHVHDRAVDGDVARRRAVEHLASVRVVVAAVVRSRPLPLATMVGDLPPSSSATGTRFSLAAFITARHTAV